MIKERPILFSGEMVNAILDGRKTQTRRVMKPQPSFENGVWRYRDKVFVTDESLKSYLFNDIYGDKGSPYGSIYSDGTTERLWVRETWHYNDWSQDGEPWIAYRADGSVRFIDWLHIPEEWNDRLINVWAELSEDFERKGRACDEHWRPSIHMPRWASRILLEITDIRVERVQDITDEDAIAEGVETDPKQWDACYTDAFIRLWDSINAKRSYGWDKNPWVRVISFKRIDQ